MTTAAGESVLGDIIADSQLAATAPSGFGDAVVGFMNPAGNSRMHIAAGDITYGPAVQPFGNSLVTMTLTVPRFYWCWDGQGDVLPPPQGAEGVQRTHLHVGGPERAARQPGRRRLDQGQRDDRRSGGVLPGHGLNSFLADGGDGFTELRNGTNRPLGRSTSTRSRRI